MTSARVVGRLGRGRAVALVAALGLVLFVLTLPTWVRAEAPTTVGTQAVAVAGSAAAPGVSSAALVVVVAGLVLGLSGRVTRVLAVIGVVLGGALALVSSIAFLRDPHPAVLQAAAAATGVTELVAEPEVTAFGVLATIVSALLVLLGAALPFLAGSWERVGRRYEVGAAAGTESGHTTEAGAGDDRAIEGRAARTRTRAMDDWDALTRGDDPSLQDPPDGGADTPAEDR